MLHNQNFKRDTRSQSVKSRAFLPSQSQRVFNTMRKSDMNKKEIVKNKSNSKNNAKIQKLIKKIFLMLSIYNIKYSI